MIVLTVTPAKAGADTHQCSPDVAGRVNSSDCSVRMGPGLRRGDGSDL